MSLSEAVEYLSKNHIVRFKDIIIVFPDCEPDSAITLLYKQVTLFIPAYKINIVLKRLHYFVYHKWMYKDDVVGFVNLLHL